MREILKFKESPFYHKIGNIYNVTKAGNVSKTDIRYRS